MSGLRLFSHFTRTREAFAASALPLFVFANPVGGERCSSEQLWGRCQRLAAAAAS